jgi:gliding motility-associated-like protein
MNIFDYDDDQLNPDHGAYWYRIVATPTATSGLTLVANSNDIFLLQKPLLYPPNAFTPNGDGLNDQFFTSPIFVKDYNIRIYNRWGEKVFESSDKKKLWDGTYRGNIPFDNVYIYQIIYTGWDGSSYFKYGNVTTLF